jgi:uncharacterized tellurite resistance protein B-like protein
MEIPELHHDEKLALVGLMEHVLIADDIVSPEEQASLDNIISTIGSNEYRSLIYNYNKTFPTTDRFKMFLSTIERQEARELIYGTLYDIAQSDFVHQNESTILDWLASEWALDISLENTEE